MGNGPSSPDESAPFEHKQAIAEQYSEEWEYWRDAYGAGPADRPGRDPLVTPLTRRRDVIIGMIEDHAHGRPLNVLDAGCGAGALITELIERNHAVAGVDISHKMAQVAQQAADGRFPGRALCSVGDIESLPFADASFDAVVAAGVLSHQLDDLPSMRELGRVVSEHGIVIVTLPNRIRLRHLLDPYYYFLVAARTVRRLTSRRSAPTGFAAFAKSDSVAVRKYYYRQLAPVFRQVGLAETSTVGLGFGPLTFFGRPFLAPERWARFSDRMEALAQTRRFRFLNVFATYWVIGLERAPGSAGGAGSVPA